MTEFWEQIESYVVEIVIGLLVLIGAVVQIQVRKFIANRPAPLHRYSQANRAIQQLLTEARIHMKADRSFVMQFKDGEKFDNTSPIFRVFMTHEVVGRGIASITSDWSGILASSISELTHILFSNVGANIRATRMTRDMCRQTTCARTGDCVSFWIDTMALDEGMLKSMLIATGSLYMAVAPIRSNHSITGFVGVDYREWADEDLPAMQHVCHLVSNVHFEFEKALKDTAKNPLKRLSNLLSSLGRDKGN